MVLGLDGDTHLLEREHHLSAQILECIGGGDGEVAFFKSRLVSQVGPLFTTTIPASLDRVNEVIPTVLMEIVANVIEDKELEFGAEIGSISQPGLPEKGLCFLG